MLHELRGMFVVLVISAVVFRIVKPTALLFCSNENFCRRRNIWLALTAAGFMSPNFWCYALVAGVLMSRAAKRETNPLALYLVLLLVVPPVEVNIPVVGIGQLFFVDNFKLLSFFILIPLTFRWRRSERMGQTLKLTRIDILLLCFGVLETLAVPAGTSVTAMLRGGFLFYVTTFVLYFVASRATASVAEVLEALSAWCVVALIMSVLAAFEALRHWLLYIDIGSRWLGLGSGGMYLMRGDSLRAQVSAGHSLALGVGLALAFGAWLYVGSRIPDRRKRVAGGMVVWAGLMAAYSRAPWLGAVIIYGLFTVFGPRPLTDGLKAAVGLLFALAIALLSPFGDRIVRVIPFLGGSVDSGGFDYRRRLAERSWELFHNHPFFGDPLVLSKMDDLRQGQGIIDFVNGYAYIGLYYGGVGLALFVLPVLIALWRAYRQTRAIGRLDPDRALLGAALIATLLGEMVMIGTSGFGAGPEKLFYVLLALVAAYGETSGFNRPPMAPGGASILNRRLAP